MSTKFDSEIREMLAQCKGDWQDVADRSGVSYSWLSKFFNGHIPNPGFGTLTKIHSHLIRRRAPGSARVKAAA